MFEQQIDSCYPTLIYPCCWVFVDHPFLRALVKLAPTPCWYVLILNARVFSSDYSQHLYLFLLPFQMLFPHIVVRMSSHPTRTELAWLIWVVS